MTQRESRTLTGEEELNDLRHVCQLGIDSNRTSEWEKEFCSSMLTRLQQYGVKTFMSLKQWEVYDRLIDKVY